MGCPPVCGLMVEPLAAADRDAPIRRQTFSRPAGSNVSSPPKQVHSPDSLHWPVVFLPP